jgi:murein DD-endopeptidase MepM/ murein hydrolase activator NlpD
MPAIVALSRSPSGARARVSLAALVVVLLVTSGLAAPEPASARNLTPIVTSLRRAQLANEGAMRSADAQVRALEHGIRRSRRSLARARDVLDRNRERFVRERSQLREVRQSWSAARRLLDDVAVTPPVLIELSLALRSVTVPPLAGDATVGTVSTSSLSVPAPSSDQLALEAHAYVTSVLAARADVAARGREMRQQARDVSRARHRLGRATRNHRSRVRHLGALRAARNGAIARREGAEAGLGSAIIAMSRYARERIAKRTDQRPGVTTGFAWPTSGRLSQGYGRGHDGIDISGYQGTPIRASAIGVVSFVGWNPWDQHGRAFMVVVAHPGRFETLYGHLLPRRAVRVGQIVRRGQVIGYMGNTGRSSGVHLHLEMRRGNVTLNPLAFL